MDDEKLEQELEKLRQQQQKTKNFCDKIIHVCTGIALGWAAGKLGLLKLIGIAL